ncbi:MAG: hypothetical protein IPL61_18955 [Myxococcales bacterium]|nr:hypothetical protein [Myxococcales bacterium]
MATVTSTSGGFSVDLSPAAIAKRVELTGRDGAPSVQHWIEWQDGDVEFKAACFDREREADLIAAFQRSVGVDVQASPVPGTWLTLRGDGREGRLRILAIGVRAYVASVEGPDGTVPAQRAHAFLLSLRAAD